MAATEMALNNPLIDEYSLQGAKGLLINITGGNDLTLFEVDQSVNKIRAEVDPEAELIFGAIKDEQMTGRIRVSIVATALDGHITENKTVLNMVSRIQNRNTGYSENLFSHNSRTENNALNSIDGATALKLDESYELEEDHNNIVKESENSFENENLFGATVDNFHSTENIPSGVSIESASYIENNSLDQNDTPLTTDEKNEEEHTPKLFSEENYKSEDLIESGENEREGSDELFNQDLSEEEDFEIPAFLRKQKF